MTELPVFGHYDPSISYRDRPAAYAVIIREGRVATVKVGANRWLPGGGMMPGETVEEAVVRELREELAWHVKPVREIARAIQYFPARSNAYHYKMEAAFLEIDVLEETGQAGEHELEWLPVEAIAERFFHASHVWAAERMAAIIATGLLRERIKSFLALSEPPAACELVRGDRVEEDGYARVECSYAAPDGEAIQCFLFEPLQPSGAAVLGLHQHNSQWLLGKSEVAGLIGDPLQAFGPALAQRGITVLAPDLPGFESRWGAIGGGAEMGPPLTRPHSTAEGWLQYFNHAAYRIARGELLMTKILSDLGAAVSALRGIESVDPNRIGVMGHSHGGNLTLFVAALDQQVSFACASGALCSYRHKFSVGTGLEMALLIPNIASHFDFDDLLRCTAPRHMLIVSSDSDPFSADAADVVASARPTFEALGCSDVLVHLHTGSGHPLDANRFKYIVDWMVERGAANYLHRPSLD